MAVAYERNHNSVIVRPPQYVPVVRLWRGLSIWGQIAVVIAALAVLAGIVVLGWVAVVHTVHPTGEIGYGDLAVAVGTLILAVGTLGSVIVGMIALQANRESLEAARDGQAATAVQFRQERMPIVMPVAEPDVDDEPDPNLIMTASTAPTKMPWSMFTDDQRTETLLSVPVENVGNGPALDVTATFVFLDQFGSKSINTTVIPMSKRAVLPALGPGKTATLRARFRGLSSPVLAFQVRIDYHDPTADGYHTYARYIEQNREYDLFTLMAPEELRLPGTEPPEIPLPQGYERVMRLQARLPTLPTRTTHRLPALDRVGQRRPPLSVPRLHGLFSQRPAAEPSMYLAVVAKRATDES